MSTTHQVAIDPLQVPLVLAQNKAQVEALNHILALKHKVLELLDSMEGHVASDNLSAALGCFIEIQKLEYQLQVSGLDEKLKQTLDIVRQLESPIALPGIRVNRT